jgi:peptidyl-Lys metalloendopeptidase
LRFVLIEAMRGLLSIIQIRQLLDMRISTMSRAFLLVVLFVSLLAGRMSSSDAKNLEGLHCALSVVPVITRDSPIHMTIQLTNRSSNFYHLLKRNTPLENFLADYLRVERIENGKPVTVPYQGPVAKRAVPSAKEYLALPPHKNFARTFALSPAYDVSLAGEYRLSWSGELMDAVIKPARINPENPTPARIQCDDIRFVRP